MFDAVPNAAPKALLIDLDGTLVDTLGDFVAALAAVASTLGVPAPQASVVRRAIGRGGQQLVRDMLAHWCRPPSDFEVAWRLYQHHYASFNGQHATLFPGTQSALSALQPRFALACVTNKPTAMADALLCRLQLRHHFDVVVGQEPALRPKPHPDALFAACLRLGQKPRHTWMVGDSSNDARAAKAAGCGAVVLLRHGYNHGEPVDATPAWAHLDRLDELPGQMARRGAS